MRSPKNVVDEMEMLCNKYGESQFTFYDDAFTVDRARVEKNMRRNTPEKDAYTVGLWNKSRYG